MRRARPRLYGLTRGRREAYVTVSASRGSRVNAGVEGGFSSPFISSTPSPFWMRARLIRNHESHLCSLSLTLSLSLPPSPSLTLPLPVPASPSLTLPHSPPLSTTGTRRRRVAAPPRIPRAPRAPRACRPGPRRPCRRPRLPYLPRLARAPPCRRQGCSPTIVLKISTHFQACCA